MGTTHDFILQIIEGAITIAFGIIAWFFLPSFPDQNTFLTQEETNIILQRVENDRGDSVPDALSMEKLCSHLPDWKLWTMGMVSEPVLLLVFTLKPFCIGFCRTHVYVRYTTRVCDQVRYFYVYYVYYILMSNSVSLLRSYCGEWAGVYRHHCYWYESLALAVVDLINSNL